MLDGLDRRAPLLAITCNVARLVAHEALSMVLLDAWLSKFLRCVAFPVAVGALDVGPVSWRRPGGSAGRPRREATRTFWSPSGSTSRSTSSRTASHKLLCDKGIDLGRLRVGRQTQSQDLGNAGLSVHVTLVFLFLLALLVLDASTRFTPLRYRF